MKRKLFGAEGSEQQTGEKKKRKKNVSDIPKHYPLSERQQMALLKRLTSAEHSPERSSPPPCTKKTPGSSRKDKINKRNERGETALHLHTIRGDLDGLVHLVQMGADVNAQDFAGWTPLHEACNHGYEDIARFLLEAGANVNSRGLEDDTPLHDAVTNANYEVVELLLKHGANPLLPNSHGQRPVDVVESDEIRKLLESEIIVSEESDVDSNNSTLMPHPSKKKSSKDIKRMSIDSDDVVNVKIKPNRKHFLISDSESEAEKTHSETDNFSMKCQSEKSKVLHKTPLLTATPTKSKSYKDYSRPFSDSSSDSEANSSKYIPEKHKTNSTSKYKNSLKSTSSEDEFNMSHSLLQHAKNKTKPFLKKPRKISGSSTCSNDTFYSSECKTESVRTKSNPDESVYDFSPSADDFTNDVDEIHLKPSKTKATEPKSLWDNFTNQWDSPVSEVPMENKKSDAVVDDSHVFQFLSKPNHLKSDDNSIDISDKLTPASKVSLSGATSVEKQPETLISKHTSIAKDVKNNPPVSDTITTPLPTSSKSNLIKTGTGENVKVKKKKQKHKAIERSLSTKSEQSESKKNLETSSIKDETNKKPHKDKNSFDESRIKDSPSKSMLKKSESCGAKLTPSKSSKKELKENKKAQLAKDHPLFSNLDKVSRQKEREKREKHRLKKKKLSQHKEKHSKTPKAMKTNLAESKVKKITEVKLLEDTGWLGTSSIDKKPLVKKQKSVLRDLSKIVVTTIYSQSTCSGSVTTTPSIAKQNFPISPTDTNKNSDANAWLMTPITSSIASVSNTVITSSYPVPVFSFPVMMSSTENNASYTNNQGDNFSGIAISSAAHTVSMSSVMIHTAPSFATASTTANVVDSSQSIMSSYAPPLLATTMATTTATNTLTTENLSAEATKEELENMNVDSAGVSEVDLAAHKTQAPASETETLQAEEVKEEEEVEEPVVYPFVPMNERELQEKLEHEEENKTRKKNIKEYIKKHVENLKVLIDKEKEGALPVIIPKSKILSKPKIKNPCKDKLNLYEEWGVIQREVLERRKKIAAPIIPQAPQCYWEYMSLTGGYLLNNSRASWLSIPALTEPISLNEDMKSLYIEHENERSRLRLQHAIQREKLIVTCEQEIMRVHGRAARTLQNQQMPLSACSVLLDKEVYCIEQRKKKSKTDVVENSYSSSSSRTASVRDRFNARMFISWLQDVDDKFDKMKDALLARQRHEANALHAVQRTEWALKLSELDAQNGQHHWTSPHDVTDIEVPLVNISDDFELLPA